MEETGGKGGQFFYRFAVGASVLVFLLIGAHFVYHFTRPETLDSDVQNRIRAIVSDEMSFKKIPGAVVGVWVEGKEPFIVCKGCSDLDGRRNMNPSDEFRIGSITKSFVATLVLQLVDEKKVSLDSPVGAYLGGIPSGDSITVRQLLNHTSGLYDFGSDPGFRSAALRDRLRSWKPEELVAISAAHGLLFHPGKSWSYSNTNYVILGMLVEKITRNPLSEEIQDRIAGPLGLASTYYPSGSSFKGRHSEGYANIDDDPSPEEITAINPSMGQGSSAMVSDLFDLKKWVEALARGTLLSRATQAERLKWTETSDGKTLRYGLGIAGYGPLIGHQGNAYGYDCSAFYYPEKKATIVVLLNKAASDTYDSASMILFRIAAVLSPGKIPGY